MRGLGLFLSAIAVSGCLTAPDKPSGGEDTLVGDGGVSESFEEPSVPELPQTGEVIEETVQVLCNLDYHCKDSDDGNCDCCCINLNSGQGQCKHFTPLQGPLECICLKLCGSNPKDD